ncbi:MAG: D-TA family PLP-dependent enzyme [Pirellulales bacterium]|jgi:D-serine deaminase-like pyridoxal phosphate-dependent protein
MYWKPELYRIENADSIFSPGLLIFRDLVEKNLVEMIRIAGGADRLRPHCKTHKTREITEIALQLGITRHKCATIAEAEMLADAGVRDILIAYQLVGPNLQRVVQLAQKYPDVEFTTLVDHPRAVTELSRAIQESGDSTISINSLVDLNSGMNRTGISIGPRAIELYEMIFSSDVLNIGGLHWYDGQNRQCDLIERTGVVNAGWDQLIRFRDQLLLSGLPVPRIVAAGTGSFSILADHGEPNLELSPGTTVFHDDDMAIRFPEMKFQPALAILTRVISCNRVNELTLDVGHKACAADQPAGRRLAFPELSSVTELMHSEEHLVIKTPDASQFKIGDHLIAIPRHACPVSAVYQFADVIVDGRVVDRWGIAGRDRMITI